MYDISDHNYVQTNVCLISTFASFACQFLIEVPVMLKE